MYVLHADVVKGAQIVAALQNCPNMPGVNDVLVELDHLVDCVKESERFYGVAFRVPVDKDAKRDPNQFDVVSDVRANLKEFYFGGSQEREFGFRTNAYFKLIVEPLLDSLQPHSHDEILDSIESIVEQIKEAVIIADATADVDSFSMYNEYRNVVADRQIQKKVKQIAAKVLQYRQKTKH